MPDRTPLASLRKAYVLKCSRALNYYARSATMHLVAHGHRRDAMGRPLPDDHRRDQLRHAIYWAHAAKQEAEALSRYLYRYALQEGALSDYEREAVMPLESE